MGAQRFRWVATLGTAGLLAGSVFGVGAARPAQAASKRPCSSDEMVAITDAWGCVALSQLTPDRKPAQELIDLGCANRMRGFRGAIYTNAGLPELPEPRRCRRGH